jgi:hypothetical protein
MTSINIIDFYTCQKNITDAGIFKDKSIFLQKNYKCFSDINKDRNILYKSKYQNNIPERPDKIKIGNRDLSREHLAKKEYMSLMNKLSEQNKKQIYNSFRTIIRDECYKLYITMTWEMLLKFPDFQKLYINLIKILYDNMENKQLFINEWIVIISEYESMKKWIPTDNILDDNDYDEFCDFQKWKKQSIGAMNCLKLIIANEWVPSITIQNISEKIIESTNYYFNLSNGIGCKITDALLDQIYVLTDQIDDKLIVDFINNWLNNGSLRASTKFKLLDIKEKVEIKLSTTYKVKHR